jgi:hypothetical protein
MVPPMGAGCPEVGPAARSRATPHTSRRGAMAHEGTPREEQGTPTGPDDSWVHGAAAHRDAPAAEAREAI